MSAVYGIGFLMLITVPMLVRAEFRNNRRQRYVLKPLSSSLLVLIILIALLMDPGNQPYKAAILLGLMFCFGGDMALMFESKKAFLVGLVLFLIGHGVYAATLVVYNGFLFRGFLVTGIITLISLLIFAFLHSGLGSMKIPVIFYVVVISFMLNSAVLTFDGDFFNPTQAWLLSTGAALFYISDVILAVNRFKKPFAYNRINLLFYYAGQYGIALSTVYFI
ncbi:lysoplasmalogenase [bacterium]|nr:lysoplasmalogenase [bacterium]